jgi:hypothetical protein
MLWKIIDPYTPFFVWASEIGPCKTCLKIWLLRSKLIKRKHIKKRSQTRQSRAIFGMKSSQRSCTFSDMPVIHTRLRRVLCGAQFLADEWLCWCLNVLRSLDINHRSSPFCCYLTVFPIYSCWYGIYFRTRHVLRYAAIARAPRHMTYEMEHIELSNLGKITIFVYNSDVSVRPGHTTSLYELVGSLNSI